jgi:hypothetical protein
MNETIKTNVTKNTTAVNYYLQNVLFINLSFKL